MVLVKILFIKHSFVVNHKKMLQTVDSNSTFFEMIIVTKWGGWLEEKQALLSSFNQKIVWFFVL